ncbi:MAG: ABC transporter substrate-binding protein [Oscillospiraceae bacterium]
MKKIIALLLALTMVFALAACSSSGDNKEETSTPPASETPDAPASETPDAPASETPDEPAPVEVDYDNPIKIGHLCDLTGNEASTGTLAQKSVDFAAKLINEQGGINGRAIEIVTEDCQSSASAAASAVRKLVENDGVVAIVGPTQIGHKQAVAPVAAEYQVPVMCYNGTPAFLAAKNEYFMSSGGGTAQMPTAMADYLYNELGCRTIYVITQEGTAGDNYVGPLKTNFEAMGGTVIEDIRVPADATDIGQYLLRVTKEADALVGWLSGTQGVTLWTTWYDQGLADKMPLYGAVHGGFTDYFIWLQLSKQRPEVVEKALELGVYAPINYAYSIDNEVNAAFVEAWKAENDGAVPVGSNLPGAGYTSLLLIKNAAESVDGEITGESLYAALQNAEANGAEGHTAFNGQKIAAKAVYIAKVVKLDNGSFNYEIVDVYEDVPVNGLTVG